MTGFSLQWYVKLMNNDAVLTAFRTSLWIALVTAAATTAIGVVTAFALVRFEFPGKEALSTLVILPALVPETILGVGLLVLIKAIDQPRTMLLSMLGHILLAVPYVVLIAQARMVGIRRVYEEAALSLGASRFSLSRNHAAAARFPRSSAERCFAFTISFDNTSASPVLAAGGRRDHAHADPFDAENIDQPGDQRARHRDDPRDRRHPLARRLDPAEPDQVEKTRRTKGGSTMKLTTTKRLERLQDQVSQRRSEPPQLPDG
ncbi:ABC transporter permease [Mesorhizobium atlanticum]